MWYNASEMSDLQTQAIEILKRQEPTTAVRAFQREIYGMTDAEIVERLESMRIKTDILTGSL